jgi:hypothetical protein
LIFFQVISILGTGALAADGSDGADYLRSCSNKYLQAPAAYLQHVLEHVCSSFVAYFAAWGDLQYPL